MKDILTILETAQRRYDGYELSFVTRHKRSCLSYEPKTYWLEPAKLTQIDGTRS